MVKKTQELRKKMDEQREAIIKQFEEKTKKTNVLHSNFYYLFLVWSFQVSLATAIAIAGKKRKFFVLYSQYLLKKKKSPNKKDNHKTTLQTYDFSAKYFIL